MRFIIPINHAGYKPRGREPVYPGQSIEVETLPAAAGVQIGV